MTGNPLVGTWKLVSAEIRSENNDIYYLFGRNAVGYLIYNEDGYVSLSVMSPDRQLFSSDRLRYGSTLEKAAAAETYMSYCGTYDLQGDTVIHHVELSLFPNWVGSDLERIVEIIGDTLLLRTRPILVDGRRQATYMIWKRV
jgi:hypothetical protein